MSRTADPNRDHVRAIVAHNMKQFIAELEQAWGREVTQEELAGLVGVSTFTIGKIVNKRTGLSFGIAEKLAAYFRRPTDDFRRAHPPKATYIPPHPARVSQI